MLDALERGETPGDRIPNLAVTVYKVRAPNSDARKGKSGGYRISYSEEDEQTIILVTIYSKTEQADIAPKEIAAIITTYEQEQSDQHTEEQTREPQEENSAKEKEGG